MQLGEAAADTKRSAGYCRPCPHDTFSGVLPPLRRTARWLLV